MKLLIFLLGLIFTFAVPPFQKPDENRHYYQAQALAHGQVTCRTNDQGIVYLPVPESAYAFPPALRAGEIAQTPDQKFFLSQFGWWPRPPDEPTVQATDWCSWSFIGYLPAATGLLLGRPTGSLMVEFYLARLVTFLVFYTSLTFGLRLTPPIFRRWLYFFALLPMTLHQASALSYDGLQLAMVPLIFGYLTRYLSHPRQVPTRTNLVGFVVSLVVFVISKPAFVPFLLLLVLIPRQKISHLLIILLLCLSAVIPFLRPLHYRDTHPGVSPTAQLSLMRRDPFVYLGTASRSMSLDLRANIEGMVGRLGWLDYGLPYSVALLALLLFSFLLVRTQGQPRFSSHALWILGLVGTMTIVAIYTSLYLTWSLVGASRIVGVQGRYLLPLIPFTAILCAQLINRVRSSMTLRQISVIIFGLWLIYEVGSAIYLRYYDYSHYGVNDLDSNSAPAAKLAPGRYTLTLPAATAKVVGFGFQISPDAIGLTSYRYTLRTADCARSLRVGYLTLFDTQPGVIHQEFVRPFWAEQGSYCLLLEPLLGGDLPLVHFYPLYLIPSLTQ